MKFLLIAFLWLAYCSLHSFLISIRFTGLISRQLKSYYAFYRLFYVLLSLVLLVPLIKYTEYADSVAPITYPTPVNTLRILLMGGSLALFSWAFFFNYDVLSFFGIRQILAFRKPDKSSKEIAKNGLLGVVRHPLYLALIIYLWCQIFSVMDLLVTALLTLYVIVGTFLEEKKLVLEFGDSYAKYQQDVPMLIPFTKRGTADR
jgi:protein-S-isoprenylcysteine O-methyltransferase Ste14